MSSISPKSILTTIFVLLFLVQCTVRLLYGTLVPVVGLCGLTIVLLCRLWCLQLCGFLCGCADCCHCMPSAATLPLFAAHPSLRHSNGNRLTAGLYFAPRRRLQRTTLIFAHYYFDFCWFLHLGLLLGCSFVTDIIIPSGI